MNSYTLRKLPEGFILTSDEDIQIGDLYYLPRTNSIYECKEDPTELNLEKDFGIGKVIAQQHQIDFYALSEEEQKEIGWFDVKKLANDAYNDSLSTMAESVVGVSAYIKGFQKAQELLSDRRFSLEDIKKAFQAGDNFGREDYIGNSREYYNEDEYIQSLSQPKSWKVELEMEDGGGYRQDSMNGCWISKWQPKLTNGKIKITKLL